MVKLRAAIQAKPDEYGASTGGHPVEKIEAEADDYDQAYELLTELVPEGWRLLWVDRGDR